MIRKISLPVIMGLALLMSVLFGAGLVKAGWSSSDNFGAEIGQLCTDSARIGVTDDREEVDFVIVTFQVNDKRLITRKVKFEKRLPAIPILSNSSSPSFQFNTSYEYVTVPWKNLPGNTDILITISNHIADDQESGLDPRVYPVVVTKCNDHDDFNDQGPSLGENWQGATSPENYSINDDRGVEVLAGGPIYWKREELFGVEQEAQVRLVKIDPKGRHRILLKVQSDEQGNPDWRHGAIAVFYEAEHVGIETYIPQMGWQSVISFTHTMKAGDRLVGRVIDSGCCFIFDGCDEEGGCEVGDTVFIFVNDKLIGADVVERISADVDELFFKGKKGSIGLWFSPSSDESDHAVFDNFKAQGNN